MRDPLKRSTKLLNCLSLSRCSSEKSPGFKALRGVWGRFLESVPLSFPAYPSYLQKALFTKCILYDIIKDNRNMEYYT